MAALLAVLAVAAFAALAFGVVRRLRAHAEDVEALSERVRELSARLDATEQDAANALAQADVAESVLLDKGVADEDDLEAARARSGVPDAAGHARARGEGELH
jgi:hypothetical protein